MHDALHPSTEDALAAWAARVRGNRDQAEAAREAPERPDFYAPVAQAFRADPRRTDDPALNILRTLVRPGESWLDIGAGGGRYALPLALELGKGEVIAVEPSGGMLAVLREGMTEHTIENIRIVESRWPMASAPQADVALIAHVGYDIEDIGPFLDAMEASAARLCVAVLLSRSPAAAAESYWEAVHGQPRVPLPALPEFLALLLARGRLFEVRLSERPPMHYHAPEDALRFLRQQLFIEEGGEKDQLLRRIAHERMTDTGGGYSVTPTPTPLGVVTWQPR